MEVNLKEIPLTEVRQRGRRLASFSARLGVPQDELEMLLSQIPRRIRHAYLAYILEDIFRLSKVSFLNLLQDEAILELSRRQLLEEIVTTVSLANKKDIFSGTYIYSIQVIEPFNCEVDLPEGVARALSEADRAQAKYGYLYHGLIYSLDDASLSSLLEKLINSSHRIEISIKPSSSEFSVRRQVIIADPSQ